MYTVLLWGMGDIYNRFYNFIKYEELKGNIKVAGIVSFETYIDSIDGYKVLHREEILHAEWDYIVVMAAGENYNEIIQDAIFFGGCDRDKIIDGTVFGVPDFDFITYIQIKQSCVSVISDCCLGGLVYHKLKLRFLSPFINTRLEKQDYIKLLENLEYYLRKPLELDERLSVSYNYPVRKLDDIHVYFPHDTSFITAEIKWNNRKKRINFDNLLFIMRIDSDMEMAERFDALPYRKKVGFSSVPMKFESICCWPEYKMDQKHKNEPIWYEMFQNRYFYEYIVSKRIRDSMNYFSLMNGDISGIRRRNVLVK